MTSSVLSSLSSSSVSSTNTGLKRSSDKNPKQITLTLPNSLVTEIFLYSKEKEMLISARVCKQWREMQTCPIVQKELITRYAFGRRQWNIYFGDIGEEPPLPSDISKTLVSPCPIWSGKQLRDTHLLILVPATVNGEALTLQSLGKLVKKPKEGNPTQYRAWHPEGNENASMTKNSWVLITRDVIPGSRNKSYDVQVALVAELAKKAKVAYEVPRLIEMITSLFVHYVRSAERLYSDSPYTYTRCQEKYDSQWAMNVGGFSASGASVNSGNYDEECYGIGAVRSVF